MGNYNPNAPILLGQQWVPILNNDVAFSPQALTQELGHGFTLAASRQLNNARYYSHDLKGNGSFYQTVVASVYPRGQEAASGPLQQVIIPVSGGSTTGAGVNVTTGGPGPGGVAQALRDPGDGNINYILFNSVASSQVDMNFGITNYPELQGKRILNVKMLYSGFVTDQDASALAIPFVNPTPATVMTLVNVGGNNYNRSPSSNTGALILNTDLAGGIIKPDHGDINELDLGDVCLFNKSIFTFTPIDVLPWTYSDVFRFDPTSGSPVTCRITCNVPVTSGGANTVQVFINYVALKVTYCEETRVAVGGRLWNQYYGMNQINMTAPFTKATNPILAAGDFTQTLAFVNPGDIGFDIGTGTETVDFNGCTQLYPIISHPGIAVNVPFPLDDHIGDAFTTQSIQILPQLSLHASGGVLTEPHVYGRQIAAQVYGNNVAQQTIYDDVIGVATAFPQVRYYARRFGETNVPLLLSSTSPPISGAVNQVQITPGDFDALPEIVDGWREVTLRFPSAPSMGTFSVDPVWQWSALGELAGNRWEILGACAPAISGVAGVNVFTQVPPPDRLSSATYQPPVGATAALSWMPQGCSSPFVTGASLDPAVDAVLIFSQDPLPITGFALTTLSQTVTGIGLNCGSLPCCIPSGIAYNRLTWPQTGGGNPALDSFNRTVVNGVGNADVGGTYAITDAATSYQVNGAELRITPAAAGPPAVASLDIGAPDFDVTVLVGGVGPVLAGTSIRGSAVGRFTDINNQYIGFVQQTAGGSTIVGILKTVASVETVLATVTLPFNIASGARVWLRFMGQGTALKVKAWTDDPADEPTSWAIETTDASLTTGNRAGVSARTGTTTGNTLGFDSLTITAPKWTFGSYELQRFDTVDGQFRTIMLAANIAVTGFSDFEARVGVPSVYRIRVNNFYNFAGAFSSQVTGAPPTPGITGGCADMTGALIFSTNAAQQGNANAAYIMQWESDTPDETFNLPEAGDVVFQQFYNRDGSVAFHGTERGLETFQRLLLVQGGAISLPSLANGKTIRDLAWGNYPYICVRDDLGNRWFATVQIPGVSVRNNRQAYMATAIITETTQIPFAVNP